jgi:hypothetical protein
MAVEDLLCARMRDDDATDDALRSGHPIWYAPAILTRDSGSMLLGASLLQGSHRGSNYNGENGGSRRYALPNDNNNATDDALRSGYPFWHVPVERARDSGSMSLGTSLLWLSHHGSNRNGDNDGGGSTRNQRSWTSQQLLCAHLT